MGEAVQLAEADDAAVSLEIMEKAEQVVDAVILLVGVPFEFEKPGTELLRHLAGFIDEVLEMRLTEGSEGIRLRVGQGGNPCRDTLTFGHSRLVSAVSGSDGYGGILHGRPLHVVADASRCIRRRHTV